MDIPTSKSVDCTVSDGTKKIPTGRIPTKRMKGMSDKVFTHKTAENARPGDKPYKLSTGRGFYLLVMPTGGKLWRYDYRLNGKRKTAALGSFPDVSLKEATEKVAEYRRLIHAGIDPVAEKRRVKESEEQQAAEQARTFEAVAREWFEKRASGKAERYRKQILARLENQLFPALGDRPFSELEAQDFLDALRPVEERGAVDMAHRLGQLLNQIGKYARVAGYVRHNEAADIREALKAREERKHRAAITDPHEIGHLLRAIDAYPGDLSIQYALKILPYVFVRSGELRCAEWEEVDFDKAMWIIPACRMKMRTPHIVPLARQVMKLFEELRQWTGDGRLVFPSPFSASQPVTDVGLLNGLRRLGYGRDEMCIHGFRGMASTLLNEQGYRPDVIEAQLAHGERNAVRAAYNHAQYLPERTAMMQEWADYLDELRAGA